MVGSVLRLAADREAARAAAVEETGRLASLVADTAHAYFDASRQILTAIAATPQVRELDPAVCTPYLRDLLSSYPEYVNLAATDAEGDVLCSAVPTSGPVSIADRTYFTQAMATGSFAIGEYSIGRITKQPVIVVGLPIRDDTGASSGIVLASLALTSLGKLAADTGLPEGAALTIVDGKGTIMVREPDPQDWVGQTLPDVPHIAAMLAGQEATVEAAGVDGMVRLYALRSVTVAGATGIHISVGFELGQLSAPADRSFWIGMALLLLAVSIALLLSWVGVSGLILRPVAELSAAADRIASGDLEARTGFSGGGEFGALAATFDRMATSVQGRVEARTADLRAALDDLREHAARLAELAALIDGTNDALFAFDPVTLRFSHVNQGAIDQVGYGRDELLAMTPLDLKPRFTEASFRSMIAPLLDGSRASHQFETVHRRKDGTELPVEILLQAVPLEGQPLRLVAVVRDITERVEADRRLREYLDIASDPLFIHRAIRDESGAAVDFEIAAFTEPALALYGPEVARVGRRLSASEPDTLEQRRAAYLRTLETGEPTVFRTRRRPPGSPNWRDISVRVTRAGDGVAVSARDITDELVNERRIQEYLDIAVDPLAVSQAIRDPETGAIVDFEAVFSNAPAAEIIGPSFSTTGTRLSAQPPDLYQRRLALWSQVVASGVPVEYDATLPHATTGEKRDLSVRITKVGDGVAIAFRDVTSTKQLQRALESARAGAERAREAAESARAEAERANHSKTEFLSRMSHELRTPLNAVIGFGQLLNLEPLTGDQRESVGHILRGGRHLLELINEVLDISRIESGSLTISPEPVHLASAVTEAVALIAPLAEDRGIGLLVEDGDRHVMADRQRLKQVLLNLLSNAVKFNRPNGTIIVSISDAAGDRVRVAIRDEGAGIPAAMRDRVFAPFDRLEAEATGVEGTGLGLALSKVLVELMGGTIGFDSVEGAGATFWFELSTAAPTAAAGDGAPSATERPSPAPRPSGSVLYIEDNLSNLQLVERLLALRADVRLIPAMLGGLGIELAREHRPDLILLDMHLPDLAGTEVMGRLLADPLTRDIPVVILSADATAAQQERLLARGAVAYLSKPIDVGEFLSVVDQLLAPRPSEEGPTSPDGTG